MVVRSGGGRYTGEVPKVHFSPVPKRRSDPGGYPIYSKSTPLVIWRDYRAFSEFVFFEIFIFIPEPFPPRTVSCEPRPALETLELHGMYYTPKRVCWREGGLGSSVPRSLSLVWRSLSAQSPRAGNRLRFRLRFQHSSTQGSFKGWTSRTHRQNSHPPCIMPFPQVATRGRSCGSLPNRTR